MKQLRLQTIARLAFGILLLLASGVALAASDDGLMRAEVGLKLFHAMMLADQDAAARADADGILTVLMVYTDDENQARYLATTLEHDITPIHGLQVNIRIMALARFRTISDLRPMAIFITQHLQDADLQKLVQLSIRQRVLLFSPFEGDVEQGVLGGLSVRTSVRPYINMHTLRQSGVRIKPFYLKVARQYGE